jgi:hypothetical protein
MRARSKLKPGQPGTRKLVEREKVKAAGGRWNPERRVWHLAMEQVLQLGLGGRVAGDDTSAPPDQARGQPEGGV